MTWTSLTFAFGSTLSSTKMTQLYDNFASFAAKEASAPVLANGYVVEAILASSAVSQGKLKTALQQQNGSNTTSVSFTGGTYTLLALLSDAGGGADVRFHAGAIGTYGTGAIIFDIPGTGSNWWMQARYITASKPYNFGDGDIPLLVYAVVNAAGEIVRIDVAEDTPWIYNGPNRINPYTVYVNKDGKKCRRVRQIVAEHGTLAAASRALQTETVLDRLMTDAFVDEEITHAVKNRDMAVIPHPFRNVPAGHTVILLDPVSPLCEHLMLLHQAEDEKENVARYLLDKHIKFDNTALNRKCPPGVMPVSFGWKLTR